MESHALLTRDLSTLERRWEQITAIPETPRTLMRVIEYSLGSQRKAEVYVNRLLRYFLDPEEPHGMETEFLAAFLDGLPEECAFQEDTYDLSQVVVDDQVAVTERDDETVVSTGIVDLVIQVPNEWFLLVELKFGAADTQTEFYYRDATHVDDTPKTGFESSAYYVYLHPGDRPTATEPEFANWTWAELSRDVLEAFLAANAPRYPQRTVNQLHEFWDDIANITTMTDQQASEHEKIELYLDHYEAIHDVTTAFDSAWEAFTDDWAARLADALEADGHGTYARPEDQLTRFDLTRSGGASEQWLFRSSSSDWGMLFKDDWWRRTDALGETIHARPDDRNDVRIGFHHRLGRNRDVAIGDHTLKVYFRNMGANDDEFISTFSDRFDENRDELVEMLPQDAELTGNQRDKVVVPYDIELAEHDTIFTAYTAALQTAYVDLVVDNDALIASIDTIFDDALTDVYPSSPDSR